MASKLELRFTGQGDYASTFTVTTGVTYRFKEQRIGYRQVAVGSIGSEFSPFELAQNFKSAFDADDNATNQYKLTVLATGNDAAGNPLPEGTFHGLLYIEHFDNTHFDTRVNNAGTFVSDTLTTTTQENSPDLTVSLLPADTDTCNKYKVNVVTNQSGERVVIKKASGQVLQDYTSTGNDSFDILRESASTVMIVQVLDVNGDKIIESKYFAPVVIAISNVKVEGSPFGASITIETTGEGNKTYSLNNVDYQSSNYFSGLLAGSYTAYMQDDLGCTKTRAFEVTEDDVNAFTAEPYFKYSIANSFRGVISKEGNTTFLNELVRDTPSLIPQDYTHRVLQGSTETIQFLSSYKTNKAYVVDCEGNQTELTPVQKSENINRLSILEGNYKDKDGRLAIYFTAGNVYNPDGSIQGEGHYYNGKVPKWFEPGTPVQIEGIGTTQIDEIFLDDVEGVTYAKTTLDGVGEGLSKKITTIYSAHDYEVFEVTYPFDTEGIYSFIIEYGNDSMSYLLTEKIEVSAELEDHLEVVWFDNKNTDEMIFYTGIKPRRFLEWEEYFKPLDDTQIESYKTDISPKKIYSQTTPKFSIKFREMPMEVARGVKAGFDLCEYVMINGSLFTCLSPCKYEGDGDRFVLSAELSLLNETSEGQQVIRDVVSTGFLKITNDGSDSPGFLRI